MKRFAFRQAQARNFLIEEVSKFLTHTCISRGEVPIELVCWRIDLLFHRFYCRKSSLDCAGTVDCTIHQSVHPSSVDMMTLVYSRGLLIWYLGSSGSVTSKEENPNRPFASVTWWLFEFSISVASLRSDRVQRVFIGDWRVVAAFRFGWKTKPGGECVWGASGNYVQQRALLASVCNVYGVLRVTIYYKGGRTSFWWELP